MPSVLRVFKRVFSLKKYIYLKKINSNSDKS